MSSTAYRYIEPDNGEVPANRAAIDLLVRLVETDAVAVTLSHADGSQESAELPTSFVEALKHIADIVGSGGRATLIPEDAELSPEDAGRILGISRPLVVRRMESGALPFRYVGAHRRCRLADVLTLKAKQVKQDALIKALVADSEELDECYGS